MDTPTIDLGTNIPDVAVPPPPPSAAPAPAPPQYVMALGEQFTREQYHESGWTDEQLLACGKLIIAPNLATIDVNPAVGMPDTVWVVIEEHDEIPPTGLFLGHNGVGFLAQTGYPLPLPKYLLNILDDAVVSMPVLDPKTQQVTGYRDRRRFNYRVVPAPANA